MKHLGRGEHLGQQLVVKPNWDSAALEKLCTNADHSRTSDQHRALAAAGGTAVGCIGHLKVDWWGRNEKAEEQSMEMMLLDAEGVVFAAADGCVGKSECCL